MEEVEYKGSKYKSDGFNLWKDGVLFDSRMPPGVKKIEEVSALLVDGEKIYYKGRFYV